MKTRWQCDFFFVSFRFFGDNYELLQVRHVICRTNAGSGYGSCGPTDATNFVCASRITVILPLFPTPRRTI